MKHYLSVILILLLFSACAERPKDFKNISIGMTKEEVRAQVGEPEKKNDILLADLWIYEGANRTIVFREDTVYNILTTTKARVDSIEASLKETGKDVKKKLKSTGDTIDSAALRIRNKIMGDSTKNN